MTALAPAMEGFFTERLIAQRRASAHTVASYRDTFRLLLGFVQRRTGEARARGPRRRADRCVSRPPRT
jgi:integrase/recombinase XerD